jgi:zeaxanthin glucosyltransferase
MARIGAFCFPGTGNINPMTALARRLRERGHEFVIFGIADTEARIRASGTEFHLIGETDYPPGTLQKLDQRLGELKGLATFRFTVERVKNTARWCCAMALRLFGERRLRFCWSTKRIWAEM